MSRDVETHSDATVARILGAYPAALARDVAAVLRVVPVAGIEPMRTDVGPGVLVAGERLHIPHRVYFPEANRVAFLALSPTQKVVFGTLYTRHNDGHVREHWVDRVVGSDLEWVAPFVLTLLGEYVIEIIQLLQVRSQAMQRDHYRRFIDENPEFVSLTCRRIVSYWDCYFRRDTPRFADHVAYQVAKEIGLWTPGFARRLER